jgi:hypothetical protein
VFKSLGYDVILGMDWLSKYYASINCREKVVVFQLLGVERFKFNGSCTEATPPLLSAIQATRNIRQRASAFLAYVTAKPEVERKLEDIPMACDYLDVFAEVVTRLPLDYGNTTQSQSTLSYGTRRIERAEGTTPRTFDRGFIRPSVSSWGAPVLFVKKKDGTMWKLNRVDYWKLNQHRLLEAKPRYHKE